MEKCFNPTVSIIVPIYNVEQYIERCVRSLFSQTIRDQLEYVFIDDNSSDASISILTNLIKEYNVRPDQIKLIRLSENQGSSHARNIGIKHACGNYIGFCDSDDWAESFMYELLLEKASINHSDIVCCNNYFRNSNQKQVIINYNTPNDIIGDMLSNSYPTCIWNKLFSRDLLNTIDKIVVPPGDMGEDFVFCIQTILKARTISFIDTPLYHYWDNTTSISNNISYQSIIKRASDLKKNSDVVFDLLNESGLSNSYKHNIFVRKILVKTMLSNAMYIKNARKLFNSIYPEINASLYFKRIPLNLKRAYFLASSGIKAYSKLLFN